MKIILFSDIHANLPALEAFFADIERHKADSIYCLGDLVGYNVWPNEVISIIRKKGIPTIAGNYDLGIGRMSEDCGCAYKSQAEKDLGAISISYTNRIMQDEERQYLRTLPAHIKLEFQLNNDRLNILLVHGSPRKINEYLFEDRDEKSLYRIIEQAGADIMCFGHTHKPYHRILPASPADTIHYRHAINVGAIGKPKDGDPRGGYVLLTINSHSSVTEQHSVEVEFIRFEYNIVKAAKGIEESPLPNEYAEMLRKGV